MESLKTLDLRPIPGLHVVWFRVYVNPDENSPETQCFRGQQTRDET